MLTRRIIPCLDVNANRVVKGIRFAGLRDAGDPAELAAAYERQGADEIVVLDVSATNEQRQTQLLTVESVRAVISIPLTVGGGVRTIDDAQRLTDAGADRVSINTAAVQQPELLSHMADRFGCQCTVLAIDATRRTDPPETQARWEVVTHAGQHRTGIDVATWAQQAESRGAGEILLTSFDRDGTRAGYDLELLQCVCDAVHIPVIASGGANHPQHLFEALQAGASAVLAASIFHQQEYTVHALKLALRELGEPVRL